MPTRIFVTGGTGFLGSYVLQQLVENGFEVRALRRTNKLPTYISAEILNKVQWVEGDVLDVMSLEEAMEGMDVVVHCAAIVSFIKRDRKELYKVNVDGTANVINIALEKKVARFIHISSVAAIGRVGGSGGHVNEEKKWEESKVNTHYAKSKHKAEMEVWRGLSEGLNGVILNPSTILGYGDWNSSSCAIFKNVYNEFAWYGPGLNGFVDVEDVARAIVLLIRSDITGERFILNGDNWSFKKLQDTVAACFHKRGPRREASPLLLRLAWRLEHVKAALNGHRPLLTRESAKVAVSKTYFENDKIRKALPGFSFTPLEITIKKACENYLGTVTALQR